MPAPTVTPELKKDLQLLKVLDLPGFGRFCRYELRFTCLDSLPAVEECH